MCSRGVAVDAGKLGIVGRNLMAIRAYRAVMRDREPGVVKGRSGPRRRGVAGVASGRVARRLVVWHGATHRKGAVPVCRVTTVTGRIRRRSQGVITPGMAERTGRRHVRPRERPPGRGVIKGSVGPEHCVMASCAHGLWILQSHMVRHRATNASRAVPVRDVAVGGPTVSRRKSVVVTGMALIAVRRYSSR